LPPNFNDYNIITNEKLRDDYFKNMRVIVEKKKYEKPVVNRNKRDYHIINNQYIMDHEGKATVTCLLIINKKKSGTSRRWSGSLSSGTRRRMTSTT
jgi:hypothetical protein